MPASEQGAAHPDGRWLTINRTLTFVRNGEDVLLLKRAPTKRIFPNRYNGVGGHIERGEDVFTSAQREIVEETGLDVRDLRLRAIYLVDANAATGISVFAFTAYSDSRDLIECDEGTLEWVPIADITSRDLVEDLPIMLPRMLAMSDCDAPLFVHLSYNDAGEMQLTFNSG
ncbi:MAG: NUDIX domain-containing protein [Chloroflexota bacterium]|nr:NUDIX domain-containing protein [Chloroflexota bacterium]